MTNKNGNLEISSNYAMSVGKFEKIVKTGKLLDTEVSGQKSLNHSSVNKSISQGS